MSRVSWITVWYLLLIGALTLLTLRVVAYRGSIDAEARRVSSEWWMLTTPEIVEAQNFWLRRMTEGKTYWDRAVATEAWHLAQYELSLRSRKEN